MSWREGPEMKEGGMAGRSPENNVFDFRAGVSRQKQGKLRGLALLVAGGLLVGILAGVLGIYWPFGSASAEARTTHSFAVCGMVRRTCVVDGDTIWLEGVKNQDRGYRHAGNLAAKMRLRIRSRHKGTRQIGGSAQSGRVLLCSDR